MMTAQTVDANPNGMIDWPSVNWKQVEQTVRRLQARIVKALKEKAFRKVKNLQRLLIKSQSARLLAVKRVTTNKGRKTPGVDGILWTTPQQKIQAVHDLEKGMKIIPLRRIYIPKKNGKMRPISIPTMSNRAQQACHLLALDPIAETCADEHSYGFRLERGAHDAIGYAFLILKRKGSPQWILEGDIKSCFDTINHQWLKENVQRGPNIEYFHPIKKQMKIYMPDFLVVDIIYEIKSLWTWNGNGTRLDWQEINEAKLQATKEMGWKIQLMIFN